MNGDRELRVVAYGRPITQGSKVKTRWGMRDDNGETLKPWREAVKTAALDATAGMDAPAFTGPVEVYIDFYFDRPQTHYRTGRNAHLLRDGAPHRPSNLRSGDVDKLQRACFDALTDAAVWKDDCLVVDVRASKWFVKSVVGLDRPGVALTIREARP